MLTSTASSYDCPRCQIGRCHPGITPYTRVMNGHVISVPQMVAFTCDVCAYQEFDRDGLLRLQAILGAANTAAPDDDDARPLPKSAAPEAPVSSKRLRSKP